MNRKSIKIFAISLFLSVPALVVAQNPPMDEESQTKQLRENIEKTIERYEDVLQLNDAQIFYADSILNANIFGMKAELDELSRKKVENSDIYQMVQDKWMDKTYNAFQRILDGEQWAKYLKMGAERDKKARDKRAAKRK